MRRSLCTISIVSGFLVGVSLGPYVKSIEWLTIAAVCISIVVSIVVWRKSRCALLIGLCCIGVSLGVARYIHATPSVQPDHLAFYNDTGTLTLIGTIIDEPDVRSDHTKLAIGAERTFHGSEWKDVEGKVLISTGKYPEFFYGDRVEITGRVVTPSDFQDFSYKDYLSRYGIGSVSYNPRIELTERGAGSMIRSGLITLKQSVEQLFNRTLPEPHSSFLAGLILGSRRSIPREVLDEFQITGLTHIIAISGFNITLIIVLVSNMLKSFRRSIQISLSITFIVMFTILVGASAAVVRASIMGVLGLIALSTQRTTEVTMNILLTAAMMNLWNPLVIHEDVGFQLSFSAVMGLIYISPLISSFLQKVPALLGLRESLAMTVSAQIMSTPIILYHFHRISAIAPLANMLVAPAIPLSMLGGSFIIMASFLPLFLRTIVSMTAWLPMTYILFTSHVLARVPRASVMDIEWGIGLSIIWYVIVIYALWKFRSRAQTGNV